MEFETVYKVKLFGEQFLKKEELEKLVQGAEAYKLLYFLKKSKYDVFNDFPHKGGQIKVLTNSSIEGPFAMIPQLSEKKGTSPLRDYGEEIIRRFMPADKVPESFERVELVEYGTRTNNQIIQYFKEMQLLGTELVDKDKIKEVGETSFHKLEEISQELKIDYNLYGTFLCRALVDNYVIGFDYSESEELFYPLLNIKVFGKEGKKPHEIIDALSGGLLKAFKPFNEIKYGLNRRTQIGLAHDFSTPMLFESLDYFDELNKLDKLDNIIL